nr:polysaccharide deacetylase family protein [Abyssogena phaseoliformis symbiont]
MTWQKMRDIQGKMMTIYNHGTSHAHFLDLDKVQIQQAQNRLNQELGKADKIFAYPYGESNLDILGQIKNMGYVAFGQHSGVVSTTSNLQNLPRFPMAVNYAKMDAFKLKVSTLSMPIVENKINPIVTNKNPPILRLTFKNPLTKSAKEKLNCFADSEVKIHW